MKTISLWQPYATLIAAGFKRIETRDWFPQSLRPGQLVAIHAAKHWTADEWELIAEDPFFHRYITLAQRRGLWSTQHPPLGGVVAIARFQGAYPTETLRHHLSQRERAFGNYGPGRYGWVFSEVRPVAIIPARGQQGLFDWEPPQEIASLYQEPLNRMEQALFSRLTGTLLSVNAGPSLPADRPTAATPTGPTRVVHCRKEAYDIYVGRPMKKYPDLKATGWATPTKTASTPQRGVSRRLTATARGSSISRSSWRACRSFAGRRWAAGARPLAAFLAICMGVCVTARCWRHSLITGAPSAKRSRHPNMYAGMRQRRVWHTPVCGKVTRECLTRDLPCDRRPPNVVLVRPSKRIEYV